MDFVVRFPEVEYEIRPNDKLNPEIHGKNSYDKSLEQYWDYWCWRQICSNGMFAMAIEKVIGGKHRQCLDPVEQAAKIEARILTE